MFGFTARKRAIKRLKKAHKRYEKTAARTISRAEALHTARVEVADVLIGDVEGYINTLANSPKSFDQSVGALSVAARDFNQVVEGIKVESSGAAVKGGVAGGASLGAGAAVAAFGPGAAMAVATTFGTASTGTAISALSGAAATNAALAWLGGGALTAGGAGMAGGKAFLALAGPIGWGLGALALTGTAFWMRSKNKKLAKKALKHTRKIKKQTQALELSMTAIVGLHDATTRHAEGVAALLTHLKATAPGDYAGFSKAQKEALGQLINHIRSLSELLQAKVS